MTTSVLLSVLLPTAASLADHRCVCCSPPLLLSLTTSVLLLLHPSPSLQPAPRQLCFPLINEPAFLA
jgi:hypothetical protein